MKLAVIIASLVAMPMKRAERLADVFVRSAAQEAVSAPVLVALAMHESGFDMAAKSPVGALGMLQLMPRLWGRHASEEKHVLMGARVLKMYERKCRTTLMALGAYRSGRCVAGPKAKATMSLAKRIKWQMDRSE